MKTLFTFLTLLVLGTSWAQIDQLDLKNALVIGQLDKPEDRFSIEVNVTELFNSRGIKAYPALNVLKIGSAPDLLSGDSVKTALAAKGIDTYVIVTVRGYDRNFKTSELKDDFQTAINAGSLFPIYREEVTSVSFEFVFFRNGKMVASDIIKCSNVGSRDGVIKKLRKGVEKRLKKRWR